MSSDLDARRRRLAELHQLSDVELDQIIAYNRWLLWVFARERHFGRGPPLNRKTWSDRCRILFLRCINVIRNRGVAP